MVAPGPPKQVVDSLVAIAGTCTLCANDSCVRCSSASVRLEFDTWTRGSGDVEICGRRGRDAGT